MAHLPNPASPPPSRLRTSLDVALVLLRVFVVLVLWLSIFVAVMFGFLMAPAVALVAFLLVFGGFERLKRLWTRAD